MATAFSYDVVDYPSTALPQAHPGQIHAVARMFGRDPARIEQCRYLEVGCGDGTHLIACADALPEATFVGLDLSVVAVERGQRLAAELGLSNVSLYAADLTTWEPPADRFDYVVAHGLYSWVPAPVRDGLLALYARTLRPQGIGYVSYNAYPGCYIRQMVWEMLKYHTDDVPDPANKIAQARGMLEFLTTGRSEGPNNLTGQLTSELDRALRREPHILYHDDLAGVNEPMYLHQFVAHARKFGLHFLAEADAHAMAIIGFPPAVAELLNGLARHDVVQKEQYLDFLRLRRFRENLLTLDPAPPQADPDPTRITTLAVASPAKPTVEPVDLASGIEVRFLIEQGATASTGEPIGKAALAILGERWPARVWFTELLRMATARLGREPTQADAETLAALLTEVWMAGMVKLHGHCPEYARTVSDRPIARPLARLQARNSGIITTMLHTTTRLDDPASRLMVQMLDGTRNRDQIAAELTAAFPADEQNQTAEPWPCLEQDMEKLASMGLLVG